MLITEIIWTTDFSKWSKGVVVVGKIGYSDVKNEMLCNHLMVQSLWKKNGPHWRHLLDTLAIILDFQGDRPENRLKIAVFGH